MLSCFHERNQAPTESIAEYLAALLSIARDCYVGTSPTWTLPASTHSAAAVGTAAALGMSTSATAATPSGRCSTLHLDIMLRDRFMCGVRDSHLQQCLLAECDITFDRAFTLALSAESAAQQQMQRQKPASEKAQYKAHQICNSARAKCEQQTVIPMHQYAFVG
ncbi:hypothetical protein HPB49_022666 [Dermacentor silvarum]|uniref:Uncharacterized protein n=1 Tax=Dermacentor silvarum TaxID=543639 RepID=A0ACB8CHN3_DERSI|nr:hypothetical protein HPB49_022666 [Dermacentor silvarum]